MQRYHCEACEVWIDSNVSPREGIKCPDCGEEMCAELKKPTLKMQTKEQKQQATMISFMAFWPYSGGNKHFCCGRVTQINDEGNVETEEFGKGYFFKPVAFFPIAKGLKIKQTLEDLEAKHGKEQNELRLRQLTEVKKAVHGLLPFGGPEALIEWQKKMKMT